MILTGNGAMARIDCEGTEEVHVHDAFFGLRRKDQIEVTW